MTESNAHDEGPYRELLPSNMSMEHDRLDQQTQAITSMMGGYDFITDIPALAQKVSFFQALEVGAGTGLRTAVLARQVQSNEAKVYGVDLSPIPALHKQPQTVEFVQGNIMQLAGNNARFQHESFDFFTSRMLGAAITDWEGYMRTAFNLLRPGGRIELQENCYGWYSALGDEISKSWRWMQVMRKAGPKIGLDFWAPVNFSRQLNDCGFVNVEAKMYKWLISKEDDHEIAQYTVNVLSSTFVNVVSRVVEKAGMTGSEDLEGLRDMEHFRKDFVETVLGAPRGTYGNFWVVTAVRP